MLHLELELWVSYQSPPPCYYLVIMQPETNQSEEHFAPLKNVTPLSKYLALSLFIILPFLGGWIGYTYAPEKIVIYEVTVSPAKEINTSGTSEMNGLTGVETEVDTSLTEEEVKKKTNEAIQSYLNQRLSTVAVLDTPTPYVQIAVAAEREGRVYCGYDNGPCHFFLQAYNADYPNIKYLGSMDSVGVFKTDTVKFTSSTTFQFSTSFGDAGVGIQQVWAMDIVTGSSTKISEQRNEVQVD